MAVWTFEQGTGSAGTEPLAYASNVKSGSLLIVMGGGSPATKNPAVPTDTRGTTYTRIRQVADTGSNDEEDTWWWGIAPSAGANTVNFDQATSFRVYIVAEFSVDAGTIALEVETGQVQASNTTATDNVTSGSVTTLGTDRLIVGFCVNNGSGTSLTAGTNFTERVSTTIEGTGGGNPAKLESRVLAAAGSVAGTWTAGANMAGANVAVAAFKATTGGATVTGAASLTTTVGIATTGFKTTTGASSSTFTLGIATTGHLDWTSSSSSTFALGVATTGTRVVLGSATQTYTVGIASQGTRTTFGSLAETFTVGVTTTASTTTVTGAASLTVTFGATTAGAKSTAGSVSLGLNVSIVTTGVRGKAITFNAVNDGTITLDPQTPGTLP